MLKVILLNAAMIGLELSFPHLGGWRWACGSFKFPKPQALRLHRPRLLDNLLLSVFTFELIVRIRNSGCRLHGRNRRSSEVATAAALSAESAGGTSDEVLS